MQFFSRDKDFYKRFMILTASIALQNLITFSVNLADNVMLGAYSETSLSGVALVNQIQFILQMLTSAIGEGAVILLSQYWGKRQLEPIRRVIGMTIKIGVLSGAVIWGLMFFMPGFFLGLFTNEAAVLSEAAAYLGIICFSYLFFAFTNTMLFALRSVETVRIGFFLSLSTLLTNCFLNYILIYGKFGAPRLGVRGAAIATLTARIIEFLLMLIYLKKYETKLHLSIRKLFDRDWEYFSDFIKPALPIICSNTIWGIAMAVQTSILGHMGQSAIASNSIATTLFQIVTVVTYGTANATSILIGKTIGTGKLEKIKAYVHSLQAIYLLIGVLTGLLLFLLKDPIIALYAVSEETTNMSLTFMAILSVTVIGSAYQMPCLTGIVRGGGDTRFVLIVDSIFMWGVVIPSAYISAFILHLPPVIVFCCLKCDQILKCFVAFVKVNRYKWIRKLTRDELPAEQ